MSNEYVMTPREYGTYIAAVQLERDAAISRAKKAEEENNTFRGALNNIRRFNHREHSGTIAYWEICLNPICKTANNALTN